MNKFDSVCKERMLKVSEGKYMFMRSERWTWELMNFVDPYSGKNKKLNCNFKTGEEILEFGVGFIHLADSVN